MSTLRTAAQQALEALAIGQDAAHEVAQTYHEAMSGYRPARHIAVDDDVRKIEDAITALRAALAEPVQEPLPAEPKFFDVVAWTGDGASLTIAHNLGSTVAQIDGLLFKPQRPAEPNRAQKLRKYTAPPQRTPLTDGQIHDCFQQKHKDKATERRQITRAIERVHGIGSQDD